MHKKGQANVSPILQLVCFSLLELQVQKVASECNPSLYTSASSLNYCSDRRTGWTSSGLWAADGCYEPGNLVKNDCGCRCVGTGFLNSGAKCVSSYDNGQGYCFTTTTSCVCPVGQESSDCGCVSKDGDWECKPGSCTPCQPGTYAGGDTLKCQKCASNKFASGAGASACVFCSNECTDNKKYISSSCTATSDIQCSVCPDGYQCNGLDKVECNENTYGSGGVCNTCVASDGQICKIKGLSTYTSGCVAGQAYAGGKCTDTPQGYYTSNMLVQGSGSVANYHISDAIPCPLGKYQDSVGSSDCKTCDRGKYSSMTGTPTCSFCEIGTYQLEQGASTCRECVSGTMYISSTQACIECMPGRFSSTNRSTSCKKCEGKGYNPFTGASICLSCPMGKTTFYELGNGFFGVGEVFDSVEGCLACPEGYYTCNCFSNTSDFSSSDFQKCLREECSDESGSTHSTCISCPSGHFCPGDGFKYGRTLPNITENYIFYQPPHSDNVIRECTRCTYDRKDYMSRECTVYQDRVCTSCSVYEPMKTFVEVPCLNQQDTIISKCNESRGDMLASGTCNPCPPGTQKKTGRMECERCPANYSSMNGTLCEPCAPGFFSTQGSSQCSFICIGNNHYSKSGHSRDCQDLYASGSTQIYAQCDALQGTSNTAVHIGNGVFMIASNVVLGRGYVWSVSPSVNRCSMLQTSIVFDRIVKIIDISPNVFKIFEEGKHGNYIRTIELVQSNSLRQIKYEKIMNSNEHKISGIYSVNASTSVSVFFISDKLTHSIYQMGENYNRKLVGTGSRDITGPLPDRTTALSFPSDIVETSEGTMFVLDDRGIWKFMHGYQTLENETLVYWCCDGLYADMARMESTHICTSNNNQDTVVFGFVLNDEARIFLIRDRHYYTEITNQAKLRFRDDTSPLVNGMIKSDKGNYIMISSKQGLGTEIIELGLDACLCDTGYFCLNNQCLKVPFGYYTNHWSNELIAYPMGTIQGKQCPLINYRTTEPAGLVCEPICTSNKLYDVKTRSCLEACDYDNGYYFEPETGDCRLCPLGTLSIVGKKGIRESCLKCIAGKYGVRPGMCKVCPSNTITIYDGSTICMPISGKQNSSSSCIADGVYGADEKCSNKRTLKFVKNLTIVGIVATSRGNIFVSTGDRFFRYNKTHDEWTCILSTLSGDGILCKMHLRDLKNNALGLIQVSDDENMVYASNVGSSCIYKFSINDPSTSSSEAWTGACENYGDANGDRHTGRLGSVFGLALMEGIEGRGSVLFVSTQSTDMGCMSIRSVSITDGKIGTLLSFNQIRSPSLIMPICLKGSSIRMASVRGSDHLYYSIANDLYAVNIYQYNENTGRLNEAVKLISNSDDKVITSVCASPRNGLLTLAKSSDDILEIFRPNTITSITTIESGIVNRNMNAIGCAGQRIWYVNNREDVVEHYITQEPLAGADSVLCSGGFVYSSTHGICVQVGIGQYTSLDNNNIAVRMCKEGTYGKNAGSASNTDCATCDDGKVSTESAVGCWSCDGSNEYAFGGSCVKTCPPGTLRIDESKVCRQCPPGYSSPGDSGCVACAAGSYANSSTGNICTPCPEGWTSPVGAFKCVIKCGNNQCGMDGEHCLPVRNKWEVMTSINVDSGNIYSVVAARGNGVFLTDSFNIKYFLDTCPSSMSIEQYESCKISAVDLLPTDCVFRSGITSRCIRGLAALAITNQYVDGLSALTRYLYAASTKTYSIHRIPIFYSAGRVDISRTQRYLSQNSFESLRYIGRGTKGFVNGAFSIAQFSSVSDLELAPDDSFILISDFNNNRIRKAVFGTNTVYTVLGMGAPCTRRGVITNDTFQNTVNADIVTCDDAMRIEASISTPQGIGISSDMRRLYTALNTENAVAFVDLSTDTATKYFDYTCVMIYENKDKEIETCEIVYNSKSCFLHRAYDVLYHKDFLYVSVRNGVTRIDLNSNACQQISGKYWDVDESTSRGYEDGIFDESEGESLARFQKPFRVALAPEDGIMYIADSENKAIRRFFIESRCQCPTGNLKLDQENTCYDSTTKWSDKSLIDCPPGQYAVEDEKTCRDCLQAMELGTTVNTCIVWHINSLRAGNILYPYLRVLGNPTPSGSINADWFGTGPRDDPAQWDSIFRDHSGTQYRLGDAEGRAPYGSDYISYRYIQDTQSWMVETDALLQPRLLLPGFWYPCTTGPLLVSPETSSCSCPPIISAFESSQSITDASSVSWHKLRLSAFEQGGRALGTYKTRAQNLRAYAKSNSSYSLRFLDYEDRIRMWGKYVIFGTDLNAENGVCKDTQKGPCFPIFKYIHDEDPFLPSISGPIVFQDSFGASEWLKDDVRELRCSVGWPAHYSCPDGYVWVGPNSSALSDTGLPPQHAEQVACISCLPGTFSSYDENLKRTKGGPYRCDMCNLGKYSSSVGSTTCELCPIGTYADTYGATSCTKCNQSNYWTLQMGTQSALSCKPCRPGTGNCNFCAAGEYQSMSAQDACLPCPIGHYSDRVNSSSCKPCPQFHVQGTPGRASCERCPLTTVPSADKSRCIDCTSSCDLTIGGVCGQGCGLNYYWSAENEACIRCARGTINVHNPCAKDFTVCTFEPSWKIVAWDIQNRPGQDIISDCAVGYHSNSEKTACVPCPAGKYGVEDQGCLNCIVGYFSNDTASTTCNICGPGTFGNMNGSSTCDLCARGKFAGGYGATTCNFCVAGSFTGVEKSSSCEMCSVGTYGIDQGRISDCSMLCDTSSGMYSGRGSTACTFCEGGTVQGVACVGCGFGMYQEMVSSAPTCFPCGPGLVNLNVTFGERENCIPCPSVTAYVPPGSNGCVESPPGTVPNSNKTGWIKCDRGKYRNRNQSECRVCDPGSFADVQGLSECVPCTEGRYSNVYGAFSCLRCSGNTISNIKGSTTCTSCASGSIASNASSTCTQCPPNTYQSNIACLLCDEGLVSVNPGSTACSPCPPWTVYQSKSCGVCEAGTVMRLSRFLENVYECIKCPAGLHNPNAGATNLSDACKPCGKGLVPSEDGASCITCSTGRTSENGISCEDCRPGFYGPDGFSCEPCPVGEYTNRYQTTWCSKCSVGKYGNGTGATSCIPCPPGTFGNETGKIFCDVCSSDLGYSSKSGAAACAPRRTLCDAGQFIVLQYDKPWKDHDCAECKPCLENEYTISVDAVDMDVIIYESKANTQDLCPGNLPYPSYRCLNSDRLPGQYLSQTTFVGSSSSGSSTYSTIENLIQNVRIVSCTTLTAAQKIFVDYVLGPKHDCYVGCKYGVDLGKGITTYSNTFSVNVNENLNQNIFLPRMVEIASDVCMTCPLTPCPIGTYRPQFTDSCGPPCGLSEYKTLCSEGNNGCYQKCIDPPEGAQYTGGSSILGSNICPWACSLGWYVNDEADGCSRCNGTNICTEGFVMIPQELCLPYHTKRDICKACVYVEGGRAISWSNTTQKCVYECRSGYYSTPDRSNCLPCNGLGSCSVGQYRDTDTCFRYGNEPICKPCSSATENMPISFTSHGGTSAYNCSALCNAGFHTILKDVSPREYVNYKVLAQKRLITSMNITCSLCLPDDGIPCHGKCAPRYFRNTSVDSDTTPGACVRCKQTYGCATGTYAPLCTGNETSDVPCLPCDPEKLMDTASRNQVRVFIPNSYVNNIDLRSKILFTGDSLGEHCPSVCNINYVQDPNDNRKCKSCNEVIKTFKDFNKTSDDPSQPSPSSFIFSHWNATPGQIWWKPAYTPLVLNFVNSIYSGNSAIPRQGICWACPPGRATQIGDVDLCTLLPGYTTPESLKYSIEKVPIPVQGTAFQVAFMREPRPRFVSFDALEAALGIGRRRLLLFTNTSVSSPPGTTATALGTSDVSVPKTYLGSCPYGWYKQVKGEGSCMVCPSGSSTVSRGSTSVAQCICYPGWRRANTTKRALSTDPCTPCPVNTYRPLIGVGEDTCMQCGENETTHGRTNATMCACKVGFVRHTTGKCVECPSGSFCRPCIDLANQTCPQAGVHIFPCFSNSSSKSGATSIENCTCNDPSLIRMARTKRKSEDIMLLMALYGLSASEFMYCFALPQHAIYNPSSGKVTCKKGWTEIWSSSSSLLQGCALCSIGYYAVKDPSLISSLRIINGKTVDEGLVCVPCPLGTFSASRDMIGNCTPCPSFQTTSAVGASSLDYCGCPPTMEKRVSDGACIGCLPYQYISKSTGRCVDCPPFSMATSLVGSSECTCIPGYTIPPQQISSSVTANGCVPCPKNTYSSHASNRQCKACPVGSMTRGVGAKSIRECGASASLCMQGYTWKSNFGCISSNFLL